MATGAGSTAVLRRVLAAVAVLAGLTYILASFQVWLTLPDGAGGTTAVTGWGYISGGAQIAGQNLNDALNGNASYRPGLIPLLFGTLAVLTGIVLAVARASTVAKSSRPSRISASVLALSGLVGLAWGILRLIVPDSAGVLETGEGSPGVGPWLTAVAGLVLLGIAAAIFVGVLDPPTPLPRKGIQP